MPTEEKKKQLAVEPTINPFTAEGAARIAQIAGRPLAPVNVTDLGSTSSVFIPPAPLPRLPGISSLTLSAPPSLPDITNTARQEELDREQDTIVARIQDKSAKLAAKSARQGELEAEQNLPGLSKQLAEINNLIRQTQAEAFAATQKSEDRLAPTFAITGEQAQIERQRAVKVYGFAAAAEAIQGNIALARDQVDRVLEAEFGGIEQEIEREKFLRQVNRDSFDLEERRQAEERDIQLVERERILAQEKEDRKTVLDIMLSAAQSGADNITLSRIMATRSPEVATALASDYLGAEFRFQQEQRRFENNLALRNMALSEAQLRLSQDKFAFERQQAAADVEGGVLTEKQIKAIDDSPQGKKLKTLGDLKLKVKAYQDLVAQYGTASFGKQKASLDAAFADLKIAYKTAAELGALQGPDIELLEEALRPATFANPLTQVFAKITGRGVGAVGASLDQAVKVIDANGETNITQLLARNPRYANSNYVQSLALPFMKPDSTTVMIGGQSVPVGSIIENAQGQRGRVNPDGTITPL